VRTASGASFSPDGRHLTFLTDITGVAEVWSVAVVPGTSGSGSGERRDGLPWPEQLTFGGERIASASYSPVENQLIICGDIGGNERTQLFLMRVQRAEDGDRDGSTATSTATSLVPLTHQPEVIHVFGGGQEDGAASNGWSPDGRRIVYATNARDARFFDIYERSVDDLNAAPRLLLQHDGTNYPAGYAPNGRAVLVERFDSNVRNALLLVDTASGEVRQLTPESGEMGDGVRGPARHLAPQWAADGRGLYLLSDHGRQFLSLAWLDLATTAMTYLREEDQWDAEGLALSRDGKRLALVTNVDGASRIELFDISSGWKGRTVLSSPDLPQGVVAGVQWSPDGTRLAFTFSPSNDAVNIWLWDVSSQTLTRATQSARGGLSDEAFVAPQLVRYPTFDDRQIPAYLFLPRGIEPRSRPVVVYVHGGPESQTRPAFNPVIQYLVSHGYGVLAPNVRGSRGYGYLYQSLDDIRLRMDSVADLAASVAWLGEQGIADARRIAVMGSSYGGFMVLAALTTYPDLWAAGVDIVGISNYVTFLGKTGPWRRKLREPEYGSLENDREFLEAISPIHHADAITAALFVVHGANDPRVPVGEAEQIVAALRARKVPVEYLRFEDEGHGLIKRANRVKAYPAIARFLDAQLRPSPADAERL
jgi:dipeptidyl aminopeptidase/acylaminoacyl peptidase